MDKIMGIIRAVLDKIRGGASWKLYATGGIALLAIVSAGYSTWQWKFGPKPPGTTEYVRVPEIKVVTRIKRVEVLGPEKIVTIEKERIVEVVRELPPAIRNDPNEQVLATAVVPPYEGDTNIISTLNTGSGEGQIFVKREPLSLFAFLNEPALGVRYGFDSHATGSQGASIYGRWNFLRVGGVRAGIYAEGGTGGDARVQLQLEYRF